MSKIGEYSRQKLDKIIDDKVGTGTGGSGDVAGPGSSTDNAIARFDGTGGKTLQNSGCTIDDSDNMAVAGDLTVTGNDIRGSGGTVITMDGSNNMEIAGDLNLGDDKKIRFGANDDAHIEYNEDGDDNLIISGSATGLVLSGAMLTFDPTTVDSGSIAGAGSYLGVTSTGQVVLTSSAGDDGGGDPGGSDTQIQYNNGGAFGGVASLTFNDSDGHLTIIDDKKLQFGSSAEASIEYDENGGNFLTISGSSEGVVLSGSVIKLDGIHTGHANIWTPPLDPHTQDDEFDSTTLDSAYEAYQIGSPAGAGSIITSAVDPYTNFTTDKTIKVNTHTTNRPSWVLMQPRNVDKEICLTKAYTFPTNVLVYARMSFQVAVTVSNNDASIALIFGGDDGSGNIDPGDQLRIYANDSDGGVTQCEYAKYDSSVWTSVAAYPPSATGHPSTMQYFALHKVGSNYYGWIGTEGHWVYMGTTTLNFTPAHVGFLFNQRTTNPLSVFGCDFIRFIETDVFPFC